MQAGSYCSLFSKYSPHQESLYDRFMSCEFGFIDTCVASLFSKYAPQVKMVFKCKYAPLYDRLMIFLCLEIYGSWCLVVGLIGVVGLAWSHSIIVGGYFKLFSFVPPKFFRNVCCATYLRI